MGDPTTIKARSAFEPADNPATIAHLNMLQAIITRLAGNSAQCKTWSLAIVSALFGLAGALKDERVMAAAIVPIVILGAVDALYLANEKAYRNLFNSVVTKIRNNTYTIADCFGLGAAATAGDFRAALNSWSVWPVYMGLIIAYILMRLSGVLTR